MKFQSFKTAWKQDTKDTQIQETIQPVLMPSSLTSQPSLEETSFELIEKPKEKRDKLTREEVIIIVLSVFCFFLLLWAVSSSIASYRISRIHSQLLEKLVLNFSRQ